jgi:uncharacterized integral membrane protein
MQVFYWIVLLIVIGIAVFAIQNSNAPLVTIKFLLWKFETSLVYTILGSVVLGILITLLFWIPRAIRASIRKRKSNQGIPSTHSAAPNSVLQGKG